MNLFYVLLCLLWFKKPIFMVVDDNARQRQKNFYEPLLCSFMPVMVQKKLLWFKIPFKTPPYSPQPARGRSLRVVCGQAKQCYQ
jgi:hypothetical protein